MALGKIGVLYAVSTFLIMWVSDVADGGTLDALMKSLA